MKKKILIILPIILLGGGYVAKGKLMPPKVVKPKIAGEIYILPQAVHAQPQATGTTPRSPWRSSWRRVRATAPPLRTPLPPAATVGTLPEEAVIRSIITNEVTNQDVEHVGRPDAGRNGLEQQILSDIKTETDVKVDQVFFTDVAVQ